MKIVDVGFKEDFKKMNVTGIFMGRRKKMEQPNRNPRV